MDVKFKLPTPFDWNVRDPVTLHELRMRRFVALVQEKPCWWEKVIDDALVSKWKQEMQEYDRIAVRREERRRSLLWALLRPLGPSDICGETADDLEEEPGPEEVDEDGGGSQRWPRDPVTALQLEWVFSVLKYSAGQRDEVTGCLATTIPCVYEASNLVPEDLRTSLVLQAGALESVPDEEKDWHPGSNRQVLDLVHPSLYCFRIGRTHVLRSAEDVASVADPVREYTAWDYFDDRPSLKGDMFRSEDFQWLPTDFEISESGDTKALSYINHLHPVRHRHLGDTITSVLQRLVPLFEKTLSGVLSPMPPLAIQVDPMNWYSDLPPEPDTADEQKHWEWRFKRRPCIPDPAPFAPPPTEGRIALSLKGRTIQVIVKLANIVLTPDNPRYAGGSWHVEGTANERVVATGLFYYASANLTPSRLAFRAQVGADPDDAETGTPYQQGDSDGWRQVFGLGRDDAMNQAMGQVVAREGKCVVFPNVYQHRVLPFELADKTAQGYRKILCFFLVDPFERVVSSSSVPPQQREWYVEEMERIPALQRLPRELYDMIAGYALEGTIAREEAEEVREELMEERRNFVVEHNETVFEVPYDLCEH